MARSDISIPNAAQEMYPSEDYGSLPLKQRLKLLLASNRIAFNNKVKSEIVIPLEGAEEALQEKGKEGCQLQSGCSAVEEMIDVISRQGTDEVKVEQAHDDGDENQLADCTDSSFETGVKAVAYEAATSVECLDELDHVVLEERLRSILKRKSSGLMAKADSFGKSHSRTAGARKEELMCGNKVNEVGSTSKSDSSKSNLNMLSDIGQSLDYSGGNISCPPRNLPMIQKNSRTHLGKRCLKYKSNSKDVVSGNIDVAPLNLTKVKVEEPNYLELQPYDAIACQMSPVNFVPLKTEVETSDNSFEDMLDHMLLRERMELMSSTPECMTKIDSSSLDNKSFEPKPTPSVQINRSRKRRKTATDSVETAMEEDAPGLLQVLVGKGVSVTEIKLYGGPESNDTLDDSTIENSFSELEEVISKLFFKRESFLKFGHLRGTNPEKASYCLECLFALVEQAKYLQFRNWPVEWGWCRELQSFIFVFEKHNRIVLERPEYGYATYFFELAYSLPISWQIKRLVIAMKLTSCSRVTLLENRPLKVGDDLSEGEAKVLMEYGWREDSGLGTLLNYYDRVVHDRKNEKESSEWRSKIGKLLMDGYNGGTIMSSDVPTKVTEYNLANPVEVKLEVNGD